MIIGREFAVSGLRSIAATEGFTIAASELGKTKTVLQVIAISGVMLGIHFPMFEQWGITMGTVGGGDRGDGFGARLLCEILAQGGWEYQIEAASGIASHGAPEAQGRPPGESCGSDSAGWEQQLKATVCYRAWVSVNAGRKSLSPRRSDARESSTSFRRSARHRQ